MSSFRPDRGIGNTGSEAATPSGQELRDPRSIALVGRRRAVRDRGGANGPLVTPIVQSTSFHQPEVGASVPHAYSRVSNPTVDELEIALGAIEDAPAAVTFSTGLGAEFALFIALLKSGDHLVLGRGLYGGTVRLARQILEPLGITSTFVDSSKPGEVAKAITGKTKLVFIETPANPTLELTDISAVARVCLEAGKGILLAVDNTFQTAVGQKPLDLGADICVYSTTKHIDGHSAALGGAITSRDEGFLKHLRFIRKATGGIQTPFNAWLTLQGLRTLPLRLREHSKNALHIARWLQTHPGIARVNYPGLSDFPQAELAKKQHLSELHGGVLSFELIGGTPVALELVKRIRLCTLAEHVGSIHSLVTHSASMTHADVPAAQRLEVGITDGLVRLSVGIEDPLDIIDDLSQAIDGAMAAAAAREGKGGVKVVKKEGASCVVNN